MKKIVEFIIKYKKFIIAISIIIIGAIISVMIFKSIYGVIGTIIGGAAYIATKKNDKKIEKIKEQEIEDEKTINNLDYDNTNNDGTIK